MQRCHVDQSVNGLDASAASIEPAHAYRTDENEPDPVIDRLEPDEFTTQQSSHIPLTTDPIHVAAGVDAFDHVMLGIRELNQASRIGPRRRMIVHRRCLVATQRLMRSLVVVKATKAVKGTLLLLQIGLDAAAALERTVQAFMTPILLRTPRMNTLRNDAQLDPPQRQPGQAAQPTGSERFAVIGANGFGQPKMAKRPLAIRTGLTVGGAAQGIAAQEETARAIAQGQWVAKLSITHPKLAFEVGAPQLIGRHRFSEGRAIGRAVALASTGFDQALTFEQLCRRAGRGQRQLGAMPLEPVEHLNRSPVAMAPTHAHDLQCRFLAHGVGVVVRRTRTLFKACLAQLAITFQPLVSRLAAYCENAAQLAQAAFATFNFTNKTEAFVHGTGLFPRHRQVLPARILSTCYPCPQISVTNVTR